MNGLMSNLRDFGFGGLRTSHTAGVAFLLCAAALVLVPMASADTPSITITPSVMKTLESNASVKVSGSGFPLRKAVVIWFDTNGNGQLDDGEPAVAVTSSLFGAFNDAPLVLRDVPAGVHLIQAGVCPGTTPPPSAEPAAGLCLGTAGAASAQFELDFSVAPTKFGSGTTVTVTGYGNQIFSPNASVTVWFDANNNSILDPGETSVSVPTDGTGRFSAQLLVKGAPGKYSMAAGPPASAAATLPIEIGTCWFQECFIDDADTVCLVGNSPSDLGSFFSDCKQIDSNYTKPTPQTPNGGFPIDPITKKISNTGPSFLGAGVLAAALNDLDPPGGNLLGPGNPACLAMQVAIWNANNTYNTDVPDAGFNLLDPLTRLTDIACGDAGGPGLTLSMYIGLWKAAGHDVPDQALIFAAVGAIQGAAAASGNPPAVLLAAQQLVAQAAVAAAVACGRVDWHCDGSDITATILADPFNAQRNPPDLQKQLIPITFFQPPFKNAPALPDPNPCTQVNGNCWGGTIGWGQVACTVLAAPVDSNGNGICEQPNPDKTDYPNDRVGLPVPGTAGANNANAPIRCATGKVIGLSIGYDGDVSFDVSDPSVLPLTNYHNFLPGPGGTDPPNGIDIEIPLQNNLNDGSVKLSTDPDILDILKQLRPGMEVNVCGHWVADMHMLWNELHPVTSLSLAPDFTLAATPADVTVQAGEKPSYTITTTLNSGPSAAVDLSVVSGLPNGATYAFTPASVTPAKGAPATSTLTLTLAKLPVGDSTLTIQGISNGVTRLTTVNLHVYDYTLAVSPSDWTVLRGGSASYTVNTALVQGSSTTNVPLISLGPPAGLPSDASASFKPASLAPGGSSVLSIGTTGPSGGSLGDFAFTVTGASPNGSTRPGAANLHLYDLSLTVAPASLQVLTTGSNSYLVGVALAPGSSLTGLPVIALSDAGLPGGTAASFSPGSGSAGGFTSTLTVTTFNAASSPGITLTITGTDGRIPEGGTRSTTATLVVLTPAQALSLVINQINSFKSAQVLNSGQANSLVTKLNQAIISLTLKPDKATGCNQLTALLNEVNSYVAQYILTPAQANLLLGGPLGINAIMAAIPCA